MTVHLHPTAQNAHVLFYTSFSTKRTELLIDFLTAASLNISPEYMNFYIIDCQDSDLYQMTKEFPHFAGGITDADELGLDCILYTESLYGVRKYFAAAESLIHTVICVHTAKARLMKLCRFYLLP